MRNLSALAFLSLALLQVYASNIGDMIGVRKNVVHHVTKNEEGTDVTDDKLWLDCDVYGKPVPYYKWYKDNVTLIGDERHTFTRTHRGSGLRVIELKPSDSGLYTCVGTNTVGNVSAKFRVTVVPAPPLRYEILKNHACIVRPIETLTDSTLHDCVRRCDALSDCKSFDVPGSAPRQCNLKKCDKNSTDLKPYTLSEFTLYLKPE